MVEAPFPQRRAFITCSARAVGPVGRLLGEVEQCLLDAGWRTRLPGRFDADPGTSLEERRRLARSAREEVARASVVVHVPAPETISGTALHRELAQAVRHDVPIILVVAMPDRERLGIAPPLAARVKQLVEATGAHVLERLADLTALADTVARKAE